MAEAMRDEVAAGSANPARHVQVDSAGAHTEDATSGKKRAAASEAGHGQQPATIKEAGEPVAPKVPPKPDEVRRGAERAPESEGQTGNAAKKDQGTSLHDGKVDPKGEVGTAGKRRVEDTEGTADSHTKAPETAVAKETVVPNGQVVSVKTVSSVAHTAPSANEPKDEPLSYEPFWRKTERGAISSEEPEIPRLPAHDSQQEPTGSTSSKKKKVEGPGASFQKGPTKVDQAAVDTKAQEIIGSIVADFHTLKESSDLGTTAKTTSTLLIKTSGRGEHTVKKQDGPANIMNERSGMLESTVANEQEFGTIKSTAIDGTTEDGRASPVSTFETNDVEKEAVAKRGSQLTTASKLVLTSAMSLSSCSQAGAFEDTRGPLPKESTDEKPAAERRSPTDHGGTTKPDQVVETDEVLSSGSIEAISITLRPESGGKELESMTETSEATIKIIPLSDSLSYKKSINKAKKEEQAKQTSKTVQPDGGNEVLELSASVQEDAISFSPEGSEVGQASVDSKMESTSTKSEASEAKTLFSKKSKLPKKQKSSMQSTSTDNVTQKPTEEVPSPEVGRQDDSRDDQIPTKTPERTDAKDQIPKKLSGRKPTKATKKDSVRKLEAASEPPDANTAAAHKQETGSQLPDVNTGDAGATADAEATVSDVHTPKTGTETSAIVSKGRICNEKPTLPKTVSDQKPTTKDTKRQPRRNKGATEPPDTNKPLVPTVEIEIEPSTVTKSTDHDESGVLPQSECTEESSKSAPVDEMSTKTQLHKATGPQKANSKKTKKNVQKTGSSSKLGSGPQRTEDIVAPKASSSTIQSAAYTESVSSVTTKKDETKTASDNAKNNHKRNVKAVKLQQDKGKIPGTTTNSGEQQAERISDDGASVIVQEDVTEVKSVVESENTNTKPAKNYPGRNLSNKTAKVTVKKSNAQSAGGSQKDTRSSHEARVRTECVSETSAANDVNVSSSKTFSDQKKSNTKIEKDQMKPSDKAGETEKKAKATEPDKNETVPSGGIIQNGNNGVQTVELVTQSSESDPRCNEEPRKTTRPTQRKPERRNAPIKENKRNITVKSNEKQPAGTAQSVTSGDSPEIKSTEIQESGAKAENTNRNPQTTDSRPSDRNRNRNRDTPPANRVESEKKDVVSDSPVAPTESSPESIIKGDTYTVHTAADTTKQILTITVAEKVVSEASSLKTPAIQKKARKEKASLKKLEEVCKQSEEEQPIRSNETSTTNNDHTIDSIPTEKIDVELESTALARKSVGAKSRISKSPSELKPKSKVAKAQMKKSSSLVAISKSKTTVLIDGAKVPLSGDTGLTKDKPVSFKKSESVTAISTDDIKRQPIEDKGIISPSRQRICSIKQQKTCKEQGKAQTTTSKGKTIKEDDSGQLLKHPSSKPIATEGNTQSNVSVGFEASESALKDAKKREENKQLATVNSNEADARGKSPRKAKADQNPKAEESLQNTGTGNVDRPAKIQSKEPHEKSVESAEIAHLSPDGKPASPHSRRQKLTRVSEETKDTFETKVPDAGEDISKRVKDVTGEKPQAARKGENIPEPGLPKQGNSPRKRTDEDVETEAKQKSVYMKHETRTNDKNEKLNTAQRKPGQVKHESVPTTVTVTIKAGDHKGTCNKSAGDSARTGETVECTISTSVKPEKEVVNRSKELGRKPDGDAANRSNEVGRAISVATKKERRSSKSREQTEQTSTVGDKTATSGPSAVCGDGAKAGSPRKQTADQKDRKAKAKDGTRGDMEEISQEQKSKPLGKAEPGPHEKQHGDTNQEQLTSAKDTGLPLSSPRKSPRGVSKPARASSPRSVVPSKIHSPDSEETKGAVRISIVEVAEIKDVPLSNREKQRSLSPSDVSSNAKSYRNEDSTKASARESPRSKQSAVKKGVVPSVRACEHSEDNMAAAIAHRSSKTDVGAPKRYESNGSENPRSTSPQRLLAQLRTFMTQASLLNKLDLKSKILECIGVNQIRDGYKIPATRGKIKESTAVVTDLQKVAAALKVGRKRLEDQATNKIIEKAKVVSIRVKESGAMAKKEVIADVRAKSSIGMADEGRKLISRAGSLRSGKHRDRKSTTGSSCLSSSSDTPRPILVKDRARKRKVRNERKGVPRVRFSETTSGLTTPSSRPSYIHGSRHTRWVSATPEIPARVKQVPPRRHASSSGPKFPVGIVSSTMLALKRMRPSNVEKCRPTSPSPSRKPSKPLPTAAAAIMAATMKAKEIAKVPRRGTKAPSQRRSRSPRTASEKKRATTREADNKRNWKSEQRTGEVVIRGLTAAAASFPAEDRMDESISEFAPVMRARKPRERAAGEYDRVPAIAQAYSEMDAPVSPIQGTRRPTEKVMPSWHSASYTPSPPRRSSRSPPIDKSPMLHVLHDNKRPVRTKTTVINSSPPQVPCSVAITKKTSVPASSGKRTTRKGASIEHVVNIDIRMGSLAKDAATPEGGRGRSESLAPKASVTTKDSSVGTEEMQVLDVCIRALPSTRNEEELDEASVHTLMRAKEKPESGGGDVEDAARDSSESMLALTDLQAGAAGDRLTGYGGDGEGEGDEDSGVESDTSSKTWPRATLVTPTTKSLAASFPRFSTSSVPEEAARATAALERSLRLVARACEARPLECDLRWSAWMSALHAGDPDAAATPFPASLSRSGRRDVDAALAAAVRVPALWLLAGLRATELGARTVKLLHWLLVRLPAEGPALRAIDPDHLKCPCKPSAAFKVRVCAGSSLDARLRWRARGLSVFEAWASPSPCQLHALVCGGATTPVGVLSLTLAGALRRAHPGYGSGASRLGSRLRCVLKCDVAHHPELVERIGADAVVVRGLDLVRVRQLLVFSEPLPEGALAAWAARALKKRRLVVTVAAILLTYLLVAAIVWVADPAIVSLGDGPDLHLRRLLPWGDEPEAPTEHPTFSFWA